MAKRRPYQRMHCHFVVTYIPQDRMSDPLFQEIARFGGMYDAIFFAQHLEEMHPRMKIMVFDGHDRIVSHDRNPA